MAAPLATLLRALGQIIVPIGIVAGIAGATGGMLERKRRKS